MKILLLSYSFYPEVGGIETVGFLLAREWVRCGHDVVVVTQTQITTASECSFLRIVRTSSLAVIFDFYRSAEVCVCNNISIRMLWPALIIRKPVLVIHHTWIGHQRSPVHPLVLFKRILSLYVTNVAISIPISKDIAVSAKIIGDPYDEQTFNSAPLPRTSPPAVLFVGRLVADKGVAVLIQALCKLRDHGVTFATSIVGSGPERTNLENIVAEMGLRDSIKFLGVIEGEALADCYRSHTICVIPSLWEEPFGVVALEALACGCSLIVTASGGLPEAAGGTARIIPKNDYTALFCALLEFKNAAPRSDPSKHLERHSSRRIAAEYISLLKWSSEADRTVL